MSRYRRREKDPLDLLMPLVGLIALGIAFVPGFKAALGSLFLLILTVLVVGLAAVVGFKLWKRGRDAMDPQGPATPTRNGTAFPPPLQLSSRSPAQVSPTVLDLGLLRQIEWKRFECVVAAYYRELGLRSRMTRVGPDGGVDVEIFDPSNGRTNLLIQCKAWNAYKVGIKPVRELFGVMAAAKVAKGAFFTTGKFTQEAITFARENQLDPVDGAELMARIRKLSPEAQQRLQAEAVQGDYATPTCPNCDVKMVLRTAGKGRNEGSNFWGCRNFPRCHQTFKSG